MDLEGNPQTSHSIKADILWEAFKDRLGQSEFQEMHLDLAMLLEASSELGCLEDPFTEEEIDQVIQNLPIDKSPGPDGFNTDFIKKCWPIIKRNFYNLCHAFHSGNLCLQSINGSFITLIPKCDEAVNAFDFRPISLLNTSMKVITKLLANRLQLVIQKVIHKNQYGFIHTRTIQNCLAWATEYLHLCHKSNKKIVILKLDFEKAYDSISWDFVEEMMTSKGFYQKLRDWIMSSVRGGRVCININGQNGPYFKTHRGLRQGDPLSPLLFNLAVDALDHILEKAKKNIKGLVPHLVSGGITHLQYADDTIIFVNND